MNVRRQLRSVFWSLLLSLHAVWKVVVTWFLVVCVALVWSLLAHNMRPEVWLEVIGAYWQAPRFAFKGVVVIVAFLGMGWIVVPSIVSFFRPPVAGKRPESRRRHTRYLLGLTGAVVVICGATVPVVEPRLAQTGIWNAMMSLLAGLSPVGLASSWGRQLYQTREFGFIDSGEPELTQLLDPSQRPQRGWQTNLDIGSIAPRIGAVVDSLNRWSREIESNAATSELIWNYVGGDSARAVGDVSLEEERIREMELQRLRRMLGESSWRGVNALRSRVADLVGVESGQVWFFPSTTRAIEVALSCLAVGRSSKGGSIPSPDRIFLTPYEHDAEIGRAEYFRDVFGAVYRQLEGVSDVVRLAHQGSIGADCAHSALAETIVEGVTGQVSERDVLLLSHVTYGGGLKLPVLEIIKMWEARGRPFRLIVDGAHAVGQFDVKWAGRPDGYVFSGHKWLYGPAALGVMVVRDALIGGTVRNRMEAAVYESLANEEADSPGERDATIALDPFVGLSEALPIVNEQVLEGQSRLKDVRASFIYYTRQADHIEVLDYSPLRQAPGIVNLQKRGGRLGYDDLAGVVQDLEWRRHVVVKAVRNPHPSVAAAIRVCLPYYLSRREIASSCKRIDEELGKVG